MCVLVQRGRRGPRLDVSEAQTAELIMGEWLMVGMGGASILKATGRRGGTPMCWLEHSLGGLLVGPIGWLVVEVYQSEKPSILVDNFTHSRTFSGIHSTFSRTGQMTQGQK